MNMCSPVEEIHLPTFSCDRKFSSRTFRDFKGSVKRNLVFQKEITDFLLEDKKIKTWCQSDRPYTRILIENPTKRMGRKGRQQWYNTNQEQIVSSSLIQLRLHSPRYKYKIIWEPTLANYQHNYAILTRHQTP